MDVKKILEEEKPVEHEISLLNLFKSLWQRAWLIIILSALAAGLIFVTISRPAPPLYESSYTVFLGYDRAKLGSENNFILDVTDRQNTDDLKNTYEIIINNSYVLTKAAEKAGIQADVSSLRSMISVEFSKESPLVNVRATCGDADKLYTFVNALELLTRSEMGRSLDNTFVSIIDRISEPVIINDTSRPIKYSVIAGLMTLIICCAVIVIKEMADDKIKSASDLELRTGIIVLASVPDVSGIKNRKGQGVQ